MSKVVVHRHAENYLKRLPKEGKARIKKVLSLLKDNPLEHSDVKQMLSEWAGYHRIRVGKVRIIFWFDESKDVVYVDHIGPRGDVYK